jgi:hypothetical protein
VAEQQDALQAFFYEGCQESLQLVDAPCSLIGERRDGFVGIGVVGEEDGIDEKRFGEFAGVPRANEGVMIATLKN